MSASLTELLTEFYEYLEIERNVSPLTIRNYKHYLNRFVSWFQGASSTLQPSAIDQNTIRRYRLFLSRYVDADGLTLKRITQNYHLIALRSFLKFLARRDVKTLSAEKIELGKAESRSLKFLARDQVARLLSQPIISEIAGLRDKALMELLFSTGLRVSELVKLNRDQINFDTREIGIIGKGRRPRVVFVSDSAADWVKRYIQERTDTMKPLFIRYGGNKHEPINNGENYRLTSRSVQRTIEKYVKKAKLPIKITPHGLRHTFATDLLSAGADLRAIQEMLGHKNIATTQVYTHVTNPQLKKIHQKFHGK